MATTETRRGTFTSREGLRALIHEIGRTELDPGEIADQIWASETDSEAHIISRCTLRDYVRHVIEQPSPELAAPNIPTQRTPEPRTRTYATPGGGHSPSAKTAAARAWVAQRLDKPVFLDNGWEKRLGECTFEDCSVLARNRYQKAGQITAEAQRFEKIGAELQARDVTTIEELPLDVLQAVLRK
jgi:hypothetical protein